MAGRGRGRGRGWGGGGNGMPMMIDDEGNAIAGNLAGPPPLFPEVPGGLPPKPQQQERLMAAVKRQRALRKAYLRSPYVLSSKSATTGGTSDLDKWTVDAPTDKSKGAAQAQQQQQRQASLLQFISLQPRAFPEELYSKRAKHASSRATSTSRRSYWEAEGKRAEDADLLEKLAKEEEGAGGTAAAGGAGRARGEPGGEAAPGTAGEEEEEEGMGLDEEEEEDDYEGDDYYQGEYFDDDEGYDEGYDDAGDEAVF